MAPKFFMCSTRPDMSALNLEVPLSPDYGTTIKAKLDGQRVGLAIDESDTATGIRVHVQECHAAARCEGTEAALVPIEQRGTDLLGRHSNVQSTVVASTPNVNTDSVLRIKLPRL